MDEFPWGQMFTAIAALGGAAIGAWGSQWGAFRSEKWQREAEDGRAEADKRYAALLSFSTALLAADVVSTIGGIREIRKAMIEFISTLRPGEGSVARYAKSAFDEVFSAPVKPGRS